MTNASRDAFEEAMKAKGWRDFEKITLGARLYIQDELNWAWEGWQAASAAVQPVAEPVAPGWKLVPIEATKAMYKAAQGTAGIKAVDGILATEQARRGPLSWPGGTTPLEQAWAAMLAAAPPSAPNAADVRDAWIAVSERLPGKSGWYLCLSNLGADVLRWSHLGWSEHHTETVTHWMPVPQPPESTEGQR